MVVCMRPTAHCCISSIVLGNDMFALFPSRTVALSLLGFGVHWYGLLYLAAFIIAWQLLPRLQHLRGLTLDRERWGTILTAGVLGVLIGGRLGFILFYAPLYFLSHPLEVFAVWQGGMASHGGFIGVAIALFYVLHRESYEMKLKIADLITVPVAIGLALGRLGNFINQELYGTPTSLPWGMSFPPALGLRHPVQLYDMMIQLSIALCCFFLLKTQTKLRPGRVFAIFLLSYGIARFFLEIVREQQGMLYGVGQLLLSEGQWLTVPLIAIALWLWTKTVTTQGK